MFVSLCYKDSSHPFALFFFLLLLFLHIHIYPQFIYIYVYRCVSKCVLVELQTWVYIHIETVSEKIDRTDMSKLEMHERIVMKIFSFPFFFFIAKSYLIFCLCSGESLTIWGWKNDVFLFYRGSYHYLCWLCSMDGCSFGKKNQFISFNFLFKVFSSCYYLKSIRKFERDWQFKMLLKVDL